MPTASVTPLISPVQNPKINGADLFTPGTVSGTVFALSWTPPVLGAPTGYRVQIATPMSTPTGPSLYLVVATLETGKTSITLPDLLSVNTTYVFVITSLLDGHANIETSPHRSALPVASADVVSAPITIGAGQ
jgi:hypothetical protein